MDTYEIEEILEECHLLLLEPNDKTDLRVTQVKENVWTELKNHVLFFGWE